MPVRVPTPLSVAIPCCSIGKFAVLSDFIGFRVNDGDLSPPFTHAPHFRSDVGAIPLLDENEIIGCYLPFLFIHIALFGSSPC
jgi:hypothetical protein